MNLKKCTKCGEVKELAEFHKCRSHKGGLRCHCKGCGSKLSKDYRKTKRGLLSQIYYNQKRASIRRNHQLPEYSKEEFVRAGLININFNRRYKVWIRSGYDKWFIPSWDRKDDYKGYSFGNFNKWMTWKENNEKGYKDRRDGINGKISKAIIGVHKRTGKVVEFHSINEAERKTGISNSGISLCCLKTPQKTIVGNYTVRKSAGGYKWRFKN